MKIDLNEQTKVDAACARRETSISVEIVRDFVYGGAQKWISHQKIVAILSRDPVLDTSERVFRSRSERYKRALQTTYRILELQSTHGWSDADTRNAFDIVTRNEYAPIVLHLAAFAPVIQAQGSQALQDKYGKLIEQKGIFGCYLQTELAHGSNVSELETTATYVPETNEFEIHSPTFTSSKWWIGGLGKTATHGVVQAKLVLPGGKDIGPHLFFVQLRSLDDHRPLPGIIIGDIGPKAMNGLAATDNGYARFDRVRVPKENMLSKFAQVTDDGRYIRPPHAKMSYGGMLSIRSSLVLSAGWNIAAAITIAVRYATVRRQGNKGPDELERQVITYPSVYHRLLPVLSHAYVFILLGRNLMNMFEQFMIELKQGDTSLLPEMHAILSGLKVLVTSTGVHDIEVARRSMGGHGYSAFAGIGRIYADYLPYVTFEGDNFVLDQQVVRAAIKAYNNLGTTSPTSLSASNQYLHLLLDGAPSMLKLCDVSWDNLADIVLFLQWRAALLVRERANHSSDFDASCDERVAKAVTEAFVGAQVSDFTLPLHARDKEAVTNLLKLYLLATLEAGLIDLLSFDGFRESSRAQHDVTRSLRMEITRLCRDLVPHAIGLTDAFGFTDWELDSALGVYEGNVYEELYKRAQMEPLNRSEVPDGYEEYIKPLLRRGQKLARADLSKL